MRYSAAIITLLILSAVSAAQSTSRARIRPGPMQATGFPNYCGDSLECIISHAPEVVRASILSVDEDQITAHVRETIKGTSTPGSTLTFSAGGWPFVVGQDVVLSLVDDKYGKKSTRCSFLHRPLILDGSRPYYRMDLHPLTTPSEVMAAVREVAAHPIDPQLKQVSLYSGGRILIVPAEPRLEVLGQQWAADKTVYKRLLALQALKPFKSEHNIAIATTLLSDTRSQETGCWGKWQVGDYDVRESAVKLMQHWKVPAPTLPMGGPILSYRTLSAPHIAWFIAPAILLVLLIAWCYYRRSAAPLRLAGCIFMLGLIAALMTLWWRSRSQVDELMFAAGSSHHELASYGGGIQYEMLRDWDDERELVYGTFDRELNDDIWAIDSQNPTSRRSVIGFTYASGTCAGPGGSIHRFGLFCIPFWAPLAVLMIPFALNLLALRRQFRRRRLGLCRHCGYDLRESPSGICPECGHEIPPKFSTTSAPILQTRNEMPIGGQPIGM